jgi:hypothetical protein
MIISCHDETRLILGMHNSVNALRDGDEMVEMCSVGLGAERKPRVRVRSGVLVARADAG